MTVDLITFCHPPHLAKLHAPKALEKVVETHRFWFNNVIVVHQNCRGLEYRPFDFPCRIVESEDYPDIHAEFGMDINDPVANEFTHGEGAKHWWVGHTLNHIIGLTVSNSKYVVFSDADCYIKSQQNDPTWIEIGIDILEKYESVFIVSPGDGGEMFEAKLSEGYRLTQNVSQQLFLCNRERLKNMEWDIDWGGEFRAPAGPMQEYYFMAEGRVWRHLDKYGLWRVILPDVICRYWHYQW